MKKIKIEKVLLIAPLLVLVLTMIGCSQFPFFNPGDLSKGNSDDIAAPAAEGDIVSTTYIVPLPFFDDLESGVAGWSSTTRSLWHLADDTNCVSPGYSSPTHAWYFGNETSCTYAGRSGSLWSPGISLPNNIDKIVISFSYFLDLAQINRRNRNAYRVLACFYRNNGRRLQCKTVFDLRSASYGSWTNSGNIEVTIPRNAAIVKLQFLASGGSPRYTLGKLGWLIDDVSISTSYRISDTTRVPDPATIANLNNVSSDGSRLVFSNLTPFLNNLRPGDVLAIGVTNKTPNGLLRKVTNITGTGGQIVVETTQATLEEAIEIGSINFSQRLTPSDIAATYLRKSVKLQTVAADGFFLNIDGILYDEDGDEDTTNDQITAKGSISFNPQFDFGFSINNWHLTHTHFIYTATTTVTLAIETRVSLFELERKIEIARFLMQPITVFIGWFPVVIVPVLKVEVGINGEVSLGITTELSREEISTAGLRYDHGNWSPVTNLSNNFHWEPPSLSVDCNFRGYVGPQLDLLLYGGVGPYANIQGYLQLDADLLRTPWWELYAGLEANVGFELEIMSHVIAGYSLKVLDYKILLAQAAEQTGTIAGSVKDAVTQQPLAGVLVQVYSNSLVGEGVTNSNGFYSLQVPAGTGYRIEFTKAGYLPAIYHNISVQTNTTTHLEAVLQIDTSHAGPGNVSGTIRDALSGAGIEGVTLSLRQGINTTEGPVVYTTSTNNNGFYSFNNIEAGNYTAQVSKTGYNTTYFTVTCIGGATTPNQDATITPILPPGETRIILTWGELPPDLDSHLTGPLPDGTRFHMYYPYAETNSGSPWPTYVKLDLDDVTSYGPETTTIYQQIEGVYRFSVHDYTNRHSTNSIALSNSGAQVHVYRGSELIATFNVPAGQEGTLWTVFEMSGSTIIPINLMSYESSSPNIQGVGTDANLLKDLPPKQGAK
jgi:hypothetical protein